jgi:hypothetical protein
MKALTILLALTLNFVSTASNTTKFVDVYRPERGHFKTLRIPMSFDTDSIARVKPRNMKIGEIYRVDYIATSYTNKLTPYQKYLNKKRWVKLNEFLDLNEGSTFEKHAYYQTKASNEEEAKKLFHGFIVYFRQPAEFVHASSLLSTDDLMNTICNRKVNEHTTAVYIPQSKRIDSVFCGDISKKQKNDINRRVMKGNVVVEWGYDSLGTDKKYYNTFYILTRVAPGIATAFAHLKDRSLFDLFRRNKITDNTLLVTDMTGSMYPYYAQLLVWHALKMSQGKKMNHVFFNDGNKKPTNKKTIGNTGGVYFNKSNDLLEVYRSMSRCMKGGYGGDLPENNFEAVQKGLKRFPNSENVIMLCDNWATPRDTSLLKSIEKPITFVMCGAEMGVNTEYVDLACQNGGEIVTIENSTKGLKAIKEGGVIKVGEKKYKKKRLGFDKLF